MRDTQTPNLSFENGLKALGFYEDDSLFLTETSQNIDPQIEFHQEKARKFKASAVYLRRLFNGNYKPQAYLFDFTQKGFHSDVENEIALIQKKIWSSGEAPLACFFFDTEIKIIDCTRHVKSSDSNQYSPVYLEEHIRIAANAHRLYNTQFAIKLKSGVFWDEEENKNRFKFSNNSAYDILISWIKKVTEVLIKENSEINKRIINKIIIQSILIKYLEEKKDDNEKNPFGDIYFHEFGNSQHFTEVLKEKGNFVKLLEKLNIDFNGNLFYWGEAEKTIIKVCNLNVLADALEGNSYSDGQLTILFDDIRLYEFNYIPVELISRLYEEFLAGDKKEGEKKKNKQDEGIFYTPSHLAKLLVDEAMPLKNYEVDLKTFKILDPACGSGIFLVLAFKRLVQWWRLQNGIDTPRTNTVLKELQKCVYGTDKEEQATQLAAFSLCLALCDELSPMQIINDLRFDDLTQTNILHTDFFIEELKPKDDQDSISIEKQKANFQKINNQKYDLVIGNPPFKAGGIKAYKNVWKYKSESKVKIPQGQIALKFLSESLPFLKENGIQCLIIKSSGLLYNSSSEEYKKFLFSRLNVIQIFDFTALARNNALWDGADVASAAIFLRNAEPDFKQNILHVTFRRTKAIRERIVFEIDDYDLHFVNRNTAISCDYIWKTNLLGGGRIKTVIDKMQQLQSLKNYAENADCTIEEGFEIGSNGEKEEEFMYKLPSLPTKAINENTIHFEKLGNIGREIKFSKIPAKSVFEAPNLIVWENIGEKRFPIFFNDVSFTFQRRLISIKSNQNNIEFLRSILNSFESYYSFYKFYLLATSGETLINRNNTFLLKDFKNIPFIGENIEFSDIDRNVITDSVEVMSDFFIHGETARAMKPIPNKELESNITSYGNKFSSVLNLMYEEGKKKFRLSEVVSYGNSFIATVFKYDDKEDGPLFHKDQNNLDIIGLSDHQVSQHLKTKRIIKLYPKKDTIVFIKPNQYRYWLSLIAYRDADKCFVDLAKANY